MSIVNKISIFGATLLFSSLAVAFEPFVVQSIQVQGNQRVSLGAVLQTLDVKAGDRLTTVESNNIIRDLYKTGFFKQVNLERKGNVLVINVIERPSISKINITGIRVKNKILDVLKDAGIAEGRIYDANLINEAQRAIEYHYFRQGKYGVKVESNVVEQERNRIELNFDIYEGDVAKIKQIKIVGNNAFSDKELLKQMELSTTNWMSWFNKDDRYSKEKLLGDIDAIRSYYMNRGYIQFSIDSQPQVSLTPDKKHVYITIHLEEGEKFTFGDVRLAGEFVVDQANLKPLLAPIVKGEVFSKQTIIDVSKSLEDKMGEYGFSRADVRIIDEVDEETKIVHLTYVLDPRHRIYVRRINITGNKTTRDDVMRRELPQMEGTWVSTIKVKDGKENILRLGFASDIEVETKPVIGSDDQVDIDYKIAEQLTGQFEVGVGFSTSDGILYKMSLSQQNFFGTGREVQISLQSSRSNQTYSFSQYNPYFTVDGVGMGYNLSYSETNLSKTSQVFNYSQDVIGAGLNWTFPLTRFDAVGFGFGYEDIKLKLSGATPPDEIQDFLRAKQENNKELYTQLSWRHSTLDKAIFPTRGSNQVAVAKLTLPGGNIHYYTITYKISKYFPIVGDYIFNLTSQLSYGNGYGKTTRLPFYRNYYAGGSDSVRGYEDRSLGPKDSQGHDFGGNALILGTAQFIFPNPIKPEAKSVRTALFLDAGQVYDVNNQHRVINGVHKLSRNPTGLRFGAGVSLIWNSPLGAPMLVSLGYPLNAKPEDRTQNFFFSFATSF